MAAALAMRVVCLARGPALSTDVWRYLWDGRVANAGINPYLYSPEAYELRGLRDGNWGLINFRHIPTIYPPTAQVLFAILARVRSSDAEAFRWAFALSDLGCVLLLIPLLRRTGRRAERAIWYAWCPLAVTECSAGAHADSFGVLLLLLAFLLAARGGERPAGGSGLALAAAVLAKGYALLAVPFFARRGGKTVVLGFVLAAIALLAPFAGAGAGMFGGLRSYLAAWKVNSSFFLVLDLQLAKLTPDHSAITRALSMGAVLLVVVGLVWRQRPGLEGMLAASFWAFGAQLALGAPTLPWYVLWLLPALCWWALPGLVLFTLTVSAQYYARWLHPGDEAARLALLWAGYVPVYALLGAQLIWRLTCGSRSAPSHSL